MQTPSSPTPVRVGSFTAFLRELPPRRINGRDYVRHRLTWTDPGGARATRDFADPADARKHAKTVAETFSAARPSLLSYKPAELAELDAAQDALAGFGVSLLSAVSEFVAARKLLPAGVGLVQAAEDYARRHPATAPVRTVAEVVAELHADRKAAGCSEEHVRDITKRLEPFAKAFAGPIASLTAPLVREHLANLRGKRGQPLTGRSRENTRRLVVTLLRFARQERYVARELVEEITELPSPRIEAPKRDIFTAEEMNRLMKAAPDDLRASLAIAGFGGLRSSEVQRLDWASVRLSERVLVVEAGLSKTGVRRVVPLPDNLVAWLTPLAQKEGSISPVARAHSLSWRWMKEARKAGLKWRANALRHSYATYRLAVAADAPRVGYEMGNSPQMIDRHYRAAATEKEGRAWFAITPAVPSNVIQLPQAAAKP